jgi:hypothetical protein
MVLHTWPPSRANDHSSLRSADGQVAIPARLRSSAIVRGKRSGLWGGFERTAYYLPRARSQARDGNGVTMLAEIFMMRLEAEARRVEEELLQSGRLRGLFSLLGNSQAKSLAGVYAAPVCQNHACADRATGAGPHRGLCVVRRVLSL